MNVAKQCICFILKPTNTPNTYRRIASINAPTIVYVGRAFAGLIFKNTNHIKMHGYKHSKLAKQSKGTYAKNVPFG